MSCELTQINTEWHPITDNIIAKWVAAGWGNIPPAICEAWDIAVRSGIAQSFPMFVTVAGAYQHDDLIGKRIISCNAEGLPLDPTNSADIELDPVTGIITSSVTAGRHWLEIGFYLEDYPDLLDEGE